MTRPTIIPKVTVNQQRQLAVMDRWREDVHSVALLVRATRVPSDQVWAILKAHGVENAAKP